MRVNSIYEPRYQSIVLLLVKARVSAGLTQEELGKITGLSQPDISKIEKFQRRIDVLEAIDWIRATNSQELAVVARTLEPRHG